MGHINTTSYFKEEVMQKRPYIQMSWCRAAIESPDEKTLQEDGRIRYYRYIEEAGKFIRVITLADGITLHNAFFDRRYKPKEH